MDTFYTIRFKRATAKRFKHFSKKVSGSYSETMEHIIDFFEWHGFRPTERFEKSIGQELIHNRKRTEAAIAIIRDIEKNQTKPSSVILQQLFEEGSRETATENEVTHAFGTPTLLDENEELAHYRESYYRIQKEHQALRQDMEQLLTKAKYIRPALGGGHVRVELDQKAFETLKTTYVHY